MRNTHASAIILSFTLARLNPLSVTHEGLSLAARGGSIHGGVEWRVPPAARAASTHTWPRVLLARPQNPTDTLTSLYGLKVNLSAI